MKCISSVFLALNFEIFLHNMLISKLYYLIVISLGHRRRVPEIIRVTENITNVRLGNISKFDFNDFNSSLV